MRQRLEKFKILLVDDRPKNLVALEAVLASPDYEVLPAGSGREAIKILEGSTCAVILLEVQMPLLNGFETAKLIRNITRAKNIPIIFVNAIQRDDALANQE